jgi:hypothetical protein
MTARKAPLRAVAKDEKAPAKPEKPKTVTEAARTGSVRELLVAMRDRVAETVENPNTPARDIASNSKRLMEIVRDIEALDAREDDEGGARAPEVQDGTFDASAV